MNRGVLLFAAAATFQAAVPQTLAAKATTAVSVVTYACRGEKVVVTHARKVSGYEYVIVRFEDKIVQMERLTGTGASDPVFVSMHGDAGSYRWRFKGESGALSWLGPEAAATEKVLFSDCRDASDELDRRAKP
ncbi:hypothetical protein EOA88_24410 [Mesorhizobium sp. M5C.F.Ca.IN.020.14.1.1]|nr:hypothetical protein EOA88_24410 [Mesorhizobium sp. M5C.F.Ca.IN.020.14.1.1]